MGFPQSRVAFDGTNGFDTMSLTVTPVVNEIVSVGIDADVNQVLLSSSLLIIDDTVQLSMSLLLLLKLMSCELIPSLLLLKLLLSLLFLLLTVTVSLV